MGGDRDCWHRGVEVVFLTIFTECKGDDTGHVVVAIAVLTDFLDGMGAFGPGGSRRQIRGVFSFYF